MSAGGVEAVRERLLERYGPVDKADGALRQALEVGVISKDEYALLRLALELGEPCPDRAAWRP